MLLITNSIGRAKRAPHWGVQSRFRVIYIICMYVYMYVCRYVFDCLWEKNTKKNCMLNCVGGITYSKHARAQKAVLGF